MFTLQYFVKRFKQQYKIGEDLEQWMHLLNHVDWCEDEHRQGLRWDDDSYCRNPLYHTNELEMVLITWLPGQSTALHGHPEHGCLMKVLEGELVEWNVCPPPPREQNNVESRRVHSKGSVSYISGSQKHQIYNASQTVPAVSLHIYSPGSYYTRPSCTSKL